MKQHSNLEALVQGDDACGQIVITHVAKPRGFHHAFKHLLSRMHAYRFGQLLVARRILCDEFAH